MYFYVTNSLMLIATEPVHSSHTVDEGDLNNNICVERQLNPIVTMVYTILYSHWQFWLNGTFFNKIFCSSLSDFLHIFSFHILLISFIFVGRLYLCISLKYFTLFAPK